MEKEFVRSFSSGHWELKLRLFTRDQIPVNYEQDFAVIIEIQDASGGANVHNEIAEEFAAIYRSVNVRRAA